MDNNELIELFVTPIRECVNYKPQFGNSVSKGYSLPDFLNLYGQDPFYSWIGLDSPYLYAAHKAAGSMTSVYRQIGIGCERLFRQIIFEQAKYEKYTYSQWGYTAKTKAGRDKYLALDGRIELGEIRNPNVKIKAELWICDFLTKLEVKAGQLNGAVFEVRQGYKSKDSKRQNGDLDKAAVAYSYNYLPVFTIFSSQIDKGHRTSLS
ncbi:MAG: hypothetical protein LUC22_04215 [Prevotella sp.]|nr:hypothetical protein [Prevotella sp.]